MPVDDTNGLRFVAAAGASPLMARARAVEIHLGITKVVMRDLYAGVFPHLFPPLTTAARLNTTSLTPSKRRWASTTASTCFPAANPMPCTIRCGFPAAAAPAPLWRLLTKTMPTQSCLLFLCVQRWPMLLVGLPSEGIQPRHRFSLLILDFTSHYAKFSLSHFYLMVATDFPCHLEAGRPIVVRRPNRFHQSPLCFDLLCSHQPFILFHGQDPLRLLRQEVLNRWASMSLQDKGRQQHIVQHATSR